MAKRKMPRCMSTQHPDNATTPFFSDSQVMEGEDEVKEAFYVYSTLGCTEQMWDSEGKEVDNYVVKKLLNNYGYYFAKNKLGKDLFLTVRVPNPGVEKTEGKILLEALEAIPRNFDAAGVFYGDEIAPIFEIILPMTTNTISLERIKNYYEKFVVGKGKGRLSSGDITVEEWIGKFGPETINVIPLVEDLGSMRNIKQIVGDYLKGKNMEYQRVFLARSDPALNYGSAAAVLILKNALLQLQGVEEEESVEIHPILGAGTAPFRGNLRPDNVDSFLKAYPSLQTYTIQSAFKYDFEPRQVIEGISKLNSTKRAAPIAVDEKRSSEIAARISSEYMKQLKVLAPLINTTAKFIPSRRKRKLHVGLFGYSRQMSGGVKLPRAIRFCCSLYSIGIPPEMLGVNALTEKDLDYVRAIYPGFDSDLRDSLKYLNRENLEKFPTLAKKMGGVLKLVDYEVDREHARLSKHILRKVQETHPETIEEEILEAAMLRKFLG
ncbi:phosphoenolpyruvate carboxylase [Candidatus Micrarchaeota archaeon]|nr:phosphoenolpyruvate carboxylase [Candidatus Micrarchaeota archaeon]